MRASRNVRRTSSRNVSTCSLTMAFWSTSSRRCEPPCRSRPSVTARCGSQLGIASRHVTGIRLGTASHRPMTMVARMADVFQVEKCNMTRRPAPQASGLLLHRFALRADIRDHGADDLHPYAFGDLDLDLRVGIAGLGHPPD